MLAGGLHEDGSDVLAARPASGFTAYLLLTASVLAGLVLKSRPFRSLKPAAVTDTHRFLAMLGLRALVLPRPGARRSTAPCACRSPACSFQGCRPTGRSRSGWASSPPS